MPVYKFHALRADGAPERGVIDAELPRDARDKLRSRGLHIVDIQSVATPAKGRRERWARPGSVRRQLELAGLTQQLGTLIEAGIPVTDALDALVEQLQGQRLESAFRQIREDITHGMSLAEALRRYEHLFGTMFIDVVGAGEAAGNLEVVLGKLATHARQQARLRGRLSAAMAYPLTVIIIGFVVVTFLMTFVIPKITTVLIRQGKVLPLPTRVLVATSDFVVAFWPALLAGSVAAVLLSAVAMRRERIATAVDGFKLRLPVLGDLYRKQAVSRFASTLGMLLESGLPATDALQITARVLENRVMRQAVVRARDRILEGSDIAATLDDAHLFPPTVRRMVAVGERTGKLETLLSSVADSYNEEVELATQKLVSLIEPALIVSLSVVVGFVVVSIVLPILEASRF